MCLILECEGRGSQSEVELWPIGQYLIPELFQVPAIQWIFRRHGSNWACDLAVNRDDVSPFRWLINTDKVGGNGTLCHPLNVRFRYLCDEAALFFRVAPAGGFHLDKEVGNTRAGGHQLHEIIKRGALF